MNGVMKKKDEGEEEEDDDDDDDDDNDERENEGVNEFICTLKTTVANDAHVSLSLLFICLKKKRLS